VSCTCMWHHILHLNSDKVMPNTPAGSAPVRTLCSCLMCLVPCVRILNAWAYTHACMLLAVLLYRQGVAAAPAPWCLWLLSHQQQQWGQVPLRSGLML
jgi:hypothetical protein